MLVPASPPAVPDDVTLAVEADHWVAALKGGLAALGAVQPISNVLCDVQPDGAIHVTDARGGGVFRIRELPDAPAAARSVPPPARPLPRAGRAPPSPVRPDDVLAELFERVGGLERQGDRASGLGFLLELAMEKTDGEAGSVFLSRLGGRELEFAVVRGPRSREIQRLGLSVPAGHGIVGFCVREDVALAVSDPERDPRFHRAVSQAIGYGTRSLLCAPIARRGVVLGALEVLNKRGGRPFDAVDLAVVGYLAHQAAALLARLDG